jgi:hypothetical protein
MTPLLALALLGAGGSLLGAGMGTLSTFVQNRNDQDKLDHDRKMAWKQYELGKASSDSQFAIQQSAALAQLGAQEARVNQEFDQAMGQFNTNLLSQAFGIQDAQVQTAMGVGEACAAAGASGTRGNAAAGLNSAYAQNRLQQGINLQERQNHESLDALGTQVSNALNDIKQERFDWGDTGYHAGLKHIEDQYNRSMAKLGQASYEWQSNVLNDPWNQGINFAGNILSGMQTGFNTGKSIFDVLKYKQGSGA